MTILRRGGVPSFARSSLRTAILASAACLMTGCAVGPDFEKPAPPDVKAYTAAPLTPTPAAPDVAGGEVQQFSQGDISADWWTLFHSKPITDLVEQALANNHDLKAARAALSVSRESVLAGRGAFYPHVSAGFAATREQDPPGALAPVPSDNAFLYNLYTPELSVSYSPDVFGLNRRTVESLKAQETSVRFQMVATYTTLTSNVVVTAIQEAAARAQLAATHQLIDIDNNMLKILQYQLDKGYASGLDLAAQKSQLATTLATLPPLVKQEGQLHDLLAVLTGEFPAQAPQQTFELANLQLPQDIPVTLPSRLVEQRPDIRQAEANLHAASAEIGVAVANRLPNIQLTANAGSEALAFSQLFVPGTNFWNLGAALTAPIFDGGTLLHQERGARANFDQTAEQYKSTVLNAFQNVADALTALQQDAEALKAAAIADDAAKTTLDLSERQYKDGYAGYLSLLTAEQGYQQAHINLIQAQSDRFADTAALFQALGGGWWNRADLTEEAHDN